MGASLLVLRFTWAPTDMPIMPGLHMDHLFYETGVMHEIPFLADAVVHIVEHYVAGCPPASIDYPGVALRAVRLLAAVTDGYAVVENGDPVPAKFYAGDPARALATTSLLLTNQYPVHTVKAGVGVAGRDKLVAVGLRYLEAVFQDPRGMHRVMMHRWPVDEDVQLEVFTGNPAVRKRLEKAFGRLVHLFQILP